MGELIRVTLPASTAGQRQAYGLVLGGIWQSLPKSTWRRLSGLQDHIALEMYGNDQEVGYRFWAPNRAMAAMLARQFKAHYSGIELSGTTEIPQTSTSVATAELQLGLGRPRALLTLRERDADPAAGLLAGLSSARHDEWSLAQILVRPGLLPDLDVQAFECLIRVASGAHHPGRARNLLGGLIAAYGQFADGNALRPMRLRVNDRRDVNALETRHWPALGAHHTTLIRDELAAICHFPSPREIRNSRLRHLTARRLPLLASHLSRGVRVGRTSGQDGIAMARIQMQDLLRHMLLVGTTGTGKSTLLCNQALDLIGLGAGLTVMDPHSSLITEIIDRIPDERLADAILVRFADVTHPVGLNFLSARPGFEFLTVDELVEVCQRIYANSYWGPVLDMTLRHTAYAALETGGTLLEMARLLDDDGYRMAVTRQVRNSETRRFLLRMSEMRDARREQQAASTLHRLQRFLGTPFIRNIVGQRESTLDIRQIMDRGKILLVDLSGIGVDNAKFLGSLLTLLFRQAALSREDTPESRRRPHFLIMDECSWFLSRSVAEMADQARKFRLGLILAAQRLSQLKAQGTLEAILAEANNLICFRMGDVQEARHLAQHLNTADLDADEIRSLGQYEVYAQILRQGTKTPAFWAQTPAPSPVLDHSSARRAWILERSREEYARPRSEVEEAFLLRERRVQHVEPEKRSRR